MLCRMPMLDLLIHVTAANKISPAAHLLQVTDEEGRFLPHKPSTPIGTVYTYYIARNSLSPVRTLVFVDPGSILVRLAGGGSMKEREKEKEKGTLMSLWLSAFDIISTFPCRFIFPIIDLPFCFFFG